MEEEGYKLIASDAGEEFDVTGDWQTEEEAIEGALEQLGFMGSDTATITIVRPDGTSFPYVAGMEIPTAGNPEVAAAERQAEYGAES